MDNNEDFFFNAALTCFKSTKIFGFSSNNASKYVSELTRSLKTTAGNNTTTDTIENVQWKWESRVFNSSSIEFSFLYIKCTKQLYRVCVLMWSQGALLLANCAPSILNPCLTWISTRFDTIIKPLHFNSDFLSNEFNRYIISNPDHRSNLDSEIVFGTPASDLQKITMRLPSKDVETFLNQNSSNILLALYKHLQHHIAIDFKQLLIIRVNCSGFILTNNGKLKIFKNTISVNEMWDTIARILEYAQS